MTLFACRLARLKLADIIDCRAEESSVTPLLNYKHGPLTHQIDRF